MQPTLRDALTKALVRLGNEGVPGVLDIMQVQCQITDHVTDTTNSTHAA